MYKFELNDFSCFFTFMGGGRVLLDGKGHYAILSVIANNCMDLHRIEQKYQKCNKICRKC